MDYRKDSALDDVLGEGIKFPKIFSKISKSTNTVKGVEKINQSIDMILSTKKGSRVLYPDFGSDLYKILFDPNDREAADLINVYVVRALEKWEPRIEIQNVDVVTPLDDNSLGPNDIDVKIRYRIKKTNIEEIYVYPLRKEGREITGMGGNR